MSIPLVVGVPRGIFYYRRADPGSLRSQPTCRGALDVSYRVESESRSSVGAEEWREVHRFCTQVNSVGFLGTGEAFCIGAGEPTFFLLFLFTRPRPT